jgi:hypothetical protein
VNGLSGRVEPNCPGTVGIDDETGAETEGDAVDTSVVANTVEGT